MREQIEISPNHSNFSDGGWRVANGPTDTGSTTLTSSLFAPVEPLPPLPLPQGDVGSSEWGMLFSAVIARMHRVVGMPGDAESLQSRLEDCLLALENLQTLLSQQRGGAGRMKRKLAVANVALEAANAALSSSRDGERRAQHLATHDKLTSLPNRYAFDERLDQALAPLDRPAPALAVFFVDLDGFKPINDCHGHAVGDELLRIVATRLVGAVRSSDLVCRIGGDEFACLVAQPLARQQLSRLAHELFAAVSSPAQIGPLKLSVRPSIGIARCPTDGDTRATLLMNADTAMFRAKRGRLGHAFFDRRSDR